MGRTQSKQSERRAWSRVALTTDDPEEAFAELQKRRATGEDGWDMAETRWLRPALRSVHRYAVIRRG